MTIPAMNMVAFFLLTATNQRKAHQNLSGDFQAMKSAILALLLAFLVGLLVLLFLLDGIDYKRATQKDRRLVNAMMLIA